MKSMSRCSVPRDSAERIRTVRCSGSDWS